MQPPMVGVESSRQVSMLFRAFYMDTNERSFWLFKTPGINRVAKRGEVGKVAARRQSRCWLFFFGQNQLRGREKNFLKLLVSIRVNFEGQKYS